MAMLETEENLDPEDWGAFRALARRGLDDALSLLEEAREGPVWRPFPEEKARGLEEPLPRGPMAFSQVLDLLRERVLPYRTGNIHPRFWGWVMGTGTADGVVADLIASAMNPHCAGYDQSASVIEGRALAWMREIFRFPATSAGLFVSGGTAANLIGLTVARNERGGAGLKQQGLRGGAALRVYASAETHSWLGACCELLGLGRAAICELAVDDDFRIDVEALRRAIAEDRERGLLPFCVVGNAGTVNTGAVDPLDELADLCREEGLWFHVDGALGGLAMLSSRGALLAGIERADSVAFDLHKWGYLQYEIGCALVRDGAAQARSFAASPAYLEAHGRGIQPGPLILADLGIQLSRGFRALRAWVAFKTHGADKIGRIIDQNIDQVAAFAARVKAEPRLELLAPVSLNVACFRYRAEGLTEPEQDAFNRELLLRIQESGIAVPSSTRIRGRFALRIANANHRSRSCDFESLLAALKDIGGALEAAPTRGMVAMSED